MEKINWFSPRRFGGTSDLTNVKRQNVDDESTPDRRRQFKGSMPIQTSGLWSRVSREHNSIRSSIDLHGAASYINSS